MGWIEAKKQCELMAKGAKLLSLETSTERDVLIKRIQRAGRTRYDSFGTSLGSLSSLVERIEHSMR